MVHLKQVKMTYNFGTDEVESYHIYTDKSTFENTPI
jgi:hypothetical protein